MDKPIDILYYHADCSDGIAGAWSIMKHATVKSVVGIDAGQIFDKLAMSCLKGLYLVFVDVCPRYEDAVELSKHNTILILDHHASAFDQFKDKPKLLNVITVFDMDRSGCQIAWDSFGKGGRPIILDYIGDRDLWKFELPNSRAINAALFHRGEITFDVLDKITWTRTKPELFDPYLKEGNLILEVQKKHLAVPEENATVRLMTVGDKTYKVWVGTCVSFLRSELGNILANKLYEGKPVDFSATYQYKLDKDEWHISLRGRKDSPDLSKITTLIGGGGHASASGFIIRKSNEKLNARTLSDVFKPLI